MIGSLFKTRAPKNFDEDESLREEGRVRNHSKERCSHAG
jgi:hypothetical protein